METYCFNYRGRMVKIQFEPLGEHRYRLEQDGQSTEVLVQAVDGHTYSVFVGETHHLVYVTVGEEAIYLHIEGQSICLEPVRESRTSRAENQEAASTAEREMTAPMPGKILKLMVTEGQRVTAGEGLFILEAMKMENEVRAPQQAVVKKIHVQEGDLVSVGEVVLELDYPEKADVES